MYLRLRVELITVGGPAGLLPLLEASTREFPLTAMVAVQPSLGGLAPLGTLGLETRFPVTGEGAGCSTACWDLLRNTLEGVARRTSSYSGPASCA